MTFLGRTFGLVVLLQVIATLLVVVVYAIKTSMREQRTTHLRTLQML